MSRTLKTDDPRVAAIRADKLVGWGSCTNIDECYGDLDLVEYLNAAGVITIEGAIRWAYKTEGLHKEHALNARWGEDDDPELVDWKTWKTETEDFNE